MSKQTYQDLINNSWMEGFVPNARGRATIKTKQIERGFYRVTRNDGEVFEIHKAHRPSSRNNTWITERQSDFRPFGDPTLGLAKLSIQLGYY